MDEEDSHPCRLSCPQLHVAAILVAWLLFPPCPPRLPRPPYLPVHPLTCSEIANSSLRFLLHSGFSQAPSVLCLSCPRCTKIAALIVADCHQPRCLKVFVRAQNGRHHHGWHIHHIHCSVHQKVINTTSDSNVCRKELLNSVVSYARPSTFPWIVAYVLACNEPFRVIFDLWINYCPNSAAC